MALFMQRLSPQKELKKLEEQERKVVREHLAAIHNDEKGKADKLLQKELVLMDRQSLLRTVMNAMQNERLTPKAAKKLKRALEYGRTMKSRSRGGNKTRRK